MRDLVKKFKPFHLLGRVAMLITIVLMAASCERDFNAPPRPMPEEPMMQAMAPGSESIASIAINNGFNELVAALVYVDKEEGTDLVNQFLTGKKQQTVFAPTDQAFFNLYDALGEEVEEISDLPSDLVLNVLLYHVVEGRRPARSVVPMRNQRKIVTLLGEPFYVNNDASIEAIGNTANIVLADISASNGFVHVIDAVLLPIE